MPRPIRIRYTIPYGAQYGAPRAGGRRIHQGCDYHCPIGTPIYGTGPGGVVTHIGYNGDPNSGSGHNVTVTYPGARITIDMHMRERTPLHVGSAVNEHTIIGYVGITGNAVNASPPGSHDHHQMTVNGKLVDPEIYYGTATASLDLTPIENEEPPKGVEMLGSIVGTVKGTGVGLSGAWFQMAPCLIVCWDASTGAYQAARINVDTIAERDAASGKPYVWNLDTVQWEAHGVGAPHGTLERLYVAMDVEQKIWRAGDGVPAVTNIDAAALKTLFAPLSDRIDALDAQADTYQAELQKLLTAGLSGTITLTPAA